MLAHQVIADHPAQGRPGPEIVEVVQHVGRTTEQQTLVGHIDHGHRRLGRDAGNTPPDEVINNDIADNQHLGRGKFFNGLLQVQPIYVF